MMEFVLSGLFFLFFIFVAIESLRFGFTVLTAEYVLASAGRLASVRQPDPSALNPNVAKPIILAGSSDRQTRANLIRADIERLQKTYGLDFLSGNQLTICPVSGACESNNDAGAPDEYVKIELRHQFNFVVFNRGFTSLTRVIYKNEVYEAPIPY